MGLLASLHKPDKQPDESSNSSCARYHAEAKQMLRRVLSREQVRPIDTSRATGHTYNGHGDSTHLWRDVLEQLGNVCHSLRKGPPSAAGHKGKKDVPRLEVVYGADNNAHNAEETEATRYDKGTVPRGAITAVSSRHGKDKTNRPDGNLIMLVLIDGEKTLGS